MSLENDVYAEMADSYVIILLCKVCLPNLVKYLPVSSAAFAVGEKQKGFTTLCDKVDAIAVAGREADACHCASLSLLQTKVSETAEKSERQIAGVMKVSMGSQNVQKHKPPDYHLSAVVSNRTAN
jgi:16S rRNA G1207 methylase RsmC